MPTHDHFPRQQCASLQRDPGDHGRPDVDLDAGVDAARISVDCRTCVCRRRCRSARAGTACETPPASSSIGRRRTRSGGAVIEEILDVQPNFDVGERIIVLTTNPTHEDVVYFCELGVRRIIRLRNRDKDLIQAGRELDVHLTAAPEHDRKEIGLAQAPLRARHPARTSHRRDRRAHRRRRAQAEARRVHGALPRRPGEHRDVKGRRRERGERLARRARQEPELLPHLPQPDPLLPPARQA